MDDDERPSRFGRRRLLGALAAVAATAGYAVSFGDDFGGEDRNSGLETPTEYGYGGTPTAIAAGSGGSADPSTTATRTTTMAHGTSTPATTSTSTPPQSPADVYGEQGYGQYEYGG